jgi:hypothetical protein
MDATWSHASRIVVTSIATAKVKTLMIALAVRGGFKLGSAGLAGVVATCLSGAACIKLAGRRIVASDTKEKAEKSDTGTANMIANGSSSMEYFRISLAASLKSPQSVESPKFPRYDVGDPSMRAIVCCKFRSSFALRCISTEIHRGPKQKLIYFR